MVEYGEREQERDASFSGNNGPVCNGVVSDIVYFTIHCIF